MKPIISTIVSAMIMACICTQAQGANKTFYSSGQILPGETWDSVTVFNNNTVVDMLGGRIGRLNTSDSLGIYDGSIFNMSQGQITVMYISMHSSSINISGGTADASVDLVFNGDSYGLISGGSVTANRLKIYYDSIMDIRGGLLQLNDFDVVTGYNELPTVNIYGHDFDYSGMVLSGYLLDGNPFSIGGVDEFEYPRFNLIPEPASFLLFALAGLFLRKRCLL
jgi:hypothetical protein